MTNSAPLHPPFFHGDDGERPRLTDEAALRPTLVKFVARLVTLQAEDGYRGPFGKGNRLARKGGKMRVEKWLAGNTYVFYQVPQSTPKNSTSPRTFCETTKTNPPSHHRQPHHRK